MVEQESSQATPAARPFQFSLRQLLAAFFVLCVFLGAYSSLGYREFLFFSLMASFVMMIGGVIAGAIWERRTFAIVSLVGILIFVPLGLIGPPREPPEPSQLYVCSN